jgi:hypothetical protein
MEKKLTSVAETNELDFDNQTSTSILPDDPESQLPFGITQCTVPVLRSFCEKIQRATRKVEEQKVVASLLNEALSTVNADPNPEEIRSMEAALKHLPFAKYREDWIVALKKGIPMDRYKDFVNTLGTRFGMPQKHMDELLDSTFAEVNQVSITEFFFHQEHDSSSEDTSDDNYFTFARIVVYRPEDGSGKQHLDVGYCFFNVKFRFGDEKIVEKILEEKDVVVHKFFWLIRGSRKETIKTHREVEQMRKFQLDFDAKDKLQDYFRWKAVNVLSQDMIKSANPYAGHAGGCDGLKEIKDLPSLTTLK